MSIVEPKAVAHRASFNKVSRKFLVNPRIHLVVQFALQFLPAAIFSPRNIRVINGLSPFTLVCDSGILQQRRCHAVAISLPTSTPVTAVGDAWACRGIDSLLRYALSRSASRW